MEVEYVPGSHLPEQLDSSDIPIPLPKVPATHAMHVPLEFAPDAVENVPA